MMTETEAKTMKVLSLPRGRTRRLLCEKVDPTQDGVTLKNRRRWTTAAPSNRAMTSVSPTVPGSNQSDSPVHRPPPAPLLLLPGSLKALPILNRNRRVQ